MKECGCLECGRTSTVPPTEMEKCQVLVRGWKHGASGMAKDRWAKDLPDDRRDLLQLYEQGYQQGCDDRIKRSNEFCTQTGYKPNVLRKEET